MKLYGAASCEAPRNSPERATEYGAAVPASPKAEALDFESLGVRLRVWVSIRARDRTVASSMQRHGRTCVRAVSLSIPGKNATVTCRYPFNSAKGCAGPSGRGAIAGIKPGLHRIRLGLCPGGLRLGGWQAPLDHLGRGFVLGHCRRCDRLAPFKIVRGQRNETHHCVDF